MKLLNILLLTVVLFSCTAKSHKSSSYVSTDTLKYTSTKKEIITVTPPRKVNLNFTIKCDSSGNVINELDYSDNNSTIQVKGNTLTFKYNQDSLLNVISVLSDSVQSIHNSQLIEKEEVTKIKFKIPEFMWYVLIFFILLSVPTIGMILKKFSII